MEFIARECPTSFRLDPTYSDNRMQLIDGTVEIDLPPRSTCEINVDLFHISNLGRPIKTTKWKTFSVFEVLLFFAIAN